MREGLHIGRFIGGDRAHSIPGFSGRSSEATTVRSTRVPEGGASCTYSNTSPSGKPRSSRRWLTGSASRPTASPHLPPVRAHGQAGAAAGRLITENDPRMVIHPHPFVDNAQPGAATCSGPCAHGDAPRRSTTPGLGECPVLVQQPDDPIRSAPRTNRGRRTNSIVGMPEAQDSPSSLAAREMRGQAVAITNPPVHDSPDSPRAAAAAKLPAPTQPMSPSNAISSRSYYG